MVLTSNRCKFIVMWLLLTSNRCKSLYFDHFCSLAVLSGLRRNSTFLIVWTSNRCKFIVIWSRLEFCVALIVLTSNRCKSLYFDHFCSLALFWMFCDVTQHFRSFWRQIDAIHYNLIAFVVFRCLECFATLQHFWSFWCYIDLIHCNLITFAVLRCFDRCFDFEHQIKEIHVIWSLL